MGQCSLLRMITTRLDSSMFDYIVLCHGVMMMMMMMTMSQL